MRIVLLSLDLERIDFEWKDRDLDDRFDFWELQYEEAVLLIVLIILQDRNSKQKKQFRS